MIAFHSLWCVHGQFQYQIYLIHSIYLHCISLNGDNRNVLLDDVWWLLWNHHCLRGTNIRGFNG